ncbi:hypothetical protein F5Y16DRAFT_411309 [Xylariaceae sp. FL0255]|nr:hypothetical protein F5Y16DRAFT_411309 [Xylariaceae sp. FL0255]
METFKISLSTGATLTGRCNMPLPSGNGDHIYQYRPLIVALHGGSYSSEYFDIHKKHTAALASTGLGVPFVSLDRPCYGDLDSPTALTILPIPENSSFPEESASLLHHVILPAVWTEFGAGCNCLVLFCHSLGTPVAIIAAGMHSRNGEGGSQYPLAGLIFSGWGSQGKENPLLAKTTVHAVYKTHVVTDAEAKLDAMLPDWASEDLVRVYAVGVKKPVPVEELVALQKVWPPRWRYEWAPAVKVPIMFGIAERDVLWVGNSDHVKDLASCFTGSDRVDGSLVKGAPHNMEMTYWSQGWFSRCFGFALECAATYGQ